MAIRSARMLSRAALVLVCALVSRESVAADAPVLPAVDPAELTVVFDAESYRVSVRARNAPLVAVLEQIASPAGFELVVTEGSGVQLDEPTSVEIQAEPVDRVLHRLLEPFDKVVVYRGGGRISRLVVSGRASQKSAEVEVPPSRPEPEPGDPRSQAPVSEEPPEDEAAGEPEPTVEAWIAALWSPHAGAFRRAFDALLEMDPALLLAELERQLAEPPAGLEPEEREQRRRLRVRAARALGTLGGDAPVELLIRAFDGTDPVVREAAAQSLARMENERARRFLEEVAREPDPERKRAAITAIAFVGRPEAVRDVAEGLDRGEVTPVDVPEDVIETVSKPPESPGCLGPEWVYPSCSRRRSPPAEPSGDETNAAHVPDPETGCLGPQWGGPSCSRE